MEKEHGWSSDLERVESSEASGSPGWILLVSLGVFAACGIAYELILATISSYLFGDSIYYFSITIGLFLCAMGLGAWLSQRIEERLFERFLWFELALALCGGLAPGILLFLGVSVGLWTYTPFLILATLLIGGLVGIELPLLTRILRQSQESLRSTLAYALAADYLGSLVGSLCFPLLLLPLFGLLAGGFVLGLLNVLTALLTALALRWYAPLKRNFLLASLIVGCFLFGALTRKGFLERRFDALAFRDQVQIRFRSPYQEIVLTQGGKPATKKRVSARRERHSFSLPESPVSRPLLSDLAADDPLRPHAQDEPWHPASASRPGSLAGGTSASRPAFVEGHTTRPMLPRRWKDDLRMFLQGRLQFSSIDEYRYHEALVHPGMSLLPRGRTVLILGGGDGLALREVLRYKEVVRVDLVDLDEKVVSLSLSHPTIRRLNEGAFEDPRLRVHIGDAFHVQRLPLARADLIVIDLPDPHAIALAKLYSVEFYRLLRSFLQPQGLLVTQASSPFFARRSFWCVRSSLEEAGYTATSYHTNVHSFGEWGFHLASPSPRPFRPLPLRVPTRYLTDELLPALFVWPRDLARLPIPSSTLLHPRIFRFYQQDTWLGDTRRLP